jgi:hypothetical protein
MEIPVAHAARSTIGDARKLAVTGGITAVGKNDVTAITLIHDTRSQ